MLVNEEESKKIKWSLYGQVAKLLKSSRLRYEETILFLFLLQNRWGWVGEQYTITEWALLSFWGSPPLGSSCPPAEESLSMPETSEKGRNYLKVIQT